MLADWLHFIGIEGGVWPILENNGNKYQLSYQGMTVLFGPLIEYQKVQKTPLTSQSPCHRD